MDKRTGSSKAGPPRWVQVVMIVFVIDLASGVFLVILGLVFSPRDQLFTQEMDYVLTVHPGDSLRVGAPQSSGQGVMVRLYGESDQFFVLRGALLTSERLVESEPVVELNEQGKYHTIYRADATWPLGLIYIEEGDTTLYVGSDQIVEVHLDSLVRREQMDNFLLALFGAVAALTMFVAVGYLLLMRTI